MAAALVAVVAALLVVAVAVGYVVRTSGPGALDPPRFVDETSSAGVHHVYGGDDDFQVGGGVAAFDCDGDERPELYLAGGGEPAALFHNDGAVGGPLAFSRVADPVTDLTAVTGAYPIDIDGDAVIDLAVLRHGGNVLLRGLGGCRFEDATAAWGLDGGNAWTTAFSATWEGDAPRPTLAFGNYTDPGAAGLETRCSDNALVRPTADGTGYAPPIALSPSWCTLSLLFSDWSRTGAVELRASNDRHYYRPDQGEEQLWQMTAGAPPRLYTEADGWRRLQIWGMGIASQDLDGDGMPEVYLTSQGDNKLQTLEDGPKQPTYKDIALAMGATANRPYVGDTALPSTGWHSEFDDVNDDGFMDLFVAKGNVEAQPDYAMEDPSNLLIGQPDGTFVEGGEAAGIVSYARARGGALVDLNADGLLDLVVANRLDEATLYRNLGAGDASSAEAVLMGHWIAVQPRQDGSNRFGIGSWLEVRAGERTLEREVTIGGGHGGGQLGWTHVGLGSATEASVRVRWPDGTVGPWQDVPVDTFAYLERGSDAPRAWEPR